MSQKESKLLKALLLSIKPSSVCAARTAGDPK